MGGNSVADRVFAARVTVAYIAGCIALVAGYRIYERLDIVEGEVAYATERLSALEGEVAEHSDRLDDLESDAGYEEEEGSADGVRFGVLASKKRGR